MTRTTKWTIVAIVTITLSGWLIYGAATAGQEGEKKANDFYACVYGGRTDCQGQK